MVVRRMTVLVVLCTLLLAVLALNGLIYPFQMGSELSPVEEKPIQSWTAADKILLGARDEVNRGVRYDASYEAMSYPGGDVSADHGACTDVVIRAFRNAGFDLQKMIHEDMKENFDLYPTTYGLSKPDTNIDHRRVRNQMRYFEIGRASCRERV